MAIVVACSRPNPVAKGANFVAAMPAATNKAALNPSGGAPENASSTSPEGSAPLAPATAIPSALQGRWGLTPRDCTSALGDAKGLLIINGGELRFYESRAVPTKDTHFAGGVLTGDFQFTGEGQTWTRFERLERHKDILVRTQGDPAASFTYAKC